MRKGVALLLAVLLLTLTVPAGAANGAELTVDSWTLTGQEESITLEVTLTGGGDSYGGGFILWYDSLCLELINLESGSALDGAMVAANPELGDGVARMSWVSLNPLAGDGVAARATFRVLSQESSQVELLNAELLDGAGNSLPLQVVNGVVAPEEEPEPSPEPDASGTPDRPQSTSRPGSDSASSAEPERPTETTQPEESVLPEESSGGEPQSWQNPYCDVEADAWYYDAVAWASEQGIFQGTAAGQFSPEEPMSRAMLATVLWRLAGDGTPDESLSAFSDASDVPSWAAEAMAWSVETGILHGDGSRILPEGDLTREMLAAMLHRFDGSETADRAALEHFPDRHTVSSWAEDAVAWAASAGILTGKNGGYLDPAGLASRAQVAVMLHRLME